MLNKGVSLFYCLIIAAISDNCIAPIRCTPPLVFSHRSRVPELTSSAHNKDIVTADVVSSSQKLRDVAVQLLDE